MKSRYELVDGVVQLLEREENANQIRNYLILEDVEDEDLEDIIKDAKLKHLRNNGIHRRILWIMLTAFTFVLFYFFIPTKIYNTKPVLISMIGAAVFVVFLTQTLGDFRSFKEFNGKNKERRDWRHKFIPILIGVLYIPLTIMFAIHFFSKKTEELENRGIKVSGVIVYGETSSYRGNVNYWVTVDFNTIEGEAMTVSELTNKAFYSSIYKGKEIEIIYSSKDPSMVTLLANEQTIKKYTGSEERGITPKDLVAVLNTEESQIKERLNHIQYGWKFDYTDSLWINENHKSVVQLDKNTYIKCVTSDGVPMEFIEVFQELGFTKKDCEDKNVIFFESEIYMASLEIVFDNNTVGSKTIIFRK